MIADTGGTHPWANFSPMMPITIETAPKRSAFYLLTAGVFYLVLSYIGEFSVRQSVVLALILASLRRLVAYSEPKSTMQFTPFWVRVRPNWYEILRDFKLIGSPDEWDAINAAWQKITESESSTWHACIWYSVLSQSANGKRTLIYLDLYKTFASEVDFGADLEPVKVNTKYGEGKIEFFMKWGPEGYDLGLEVPEDWWKNRKNQCPNVLDEHKMHRYGSVRLTLARIPYSEFALYWEPFEYDWKLIDRTHERCKVARKRHGWNEVERDPDLPNWPEEITHRYFTVQHKEI